MVQKSTQPDEDPAGFDLDALIAAARTEPGITVYDQTSKVVDTAKAFAAKYGLEATGVKVELGAIDKVLKENQSGNVIGDVVINEDLPTYAVELLDQGVLVNWVPGDMKSSIKPEDQYPLIVHYGPMGWVYNDQTYPSCPVSNIWQLTDAQFKGRVAMADPLSNAKYPYWFNTMALNDDAALRSAYKEQFGSELTTDQPDAAHEWVKRSRRTVPSSTQQRRGGLRSRRRPGPEGPELRPHLHGEVPQHRQGGLSPGSLRRHETVGTAVIPVGDRVRGEDGQPQCRQALHPLHADQGGLRHTARRRQARRELPDTRTGRPVPGEGLSGPDGAVPQRRPRQ